MVAIYSYHIAIAIAATECLFSYIKLDFSFTIVSSSLLFWVEWIPNSLSHDMHCKK